MRPQKRYWQRETKRCVPRRQLKKCKLGLKKWKIMKRHIKIYFIPWKRWEKWPNWDKNPFKVTKVRLTKMHSLLALRFIVVKFATRNLSAVMRLSLAEQKIVIYSTWPASRWGCKIFYRMQISATMLANNVNKCSKIWYSLLAPRLLCPQKTRYLRVNLMTTIV